MNNFYNYTDPAYLIYEDPDACLPIAQPKQLTQAEHDSLVLPNDSEREVIREHV